MIFVFDIDGTICSDTKGKYVEATPVQARIDKINELYDQGNIIVFMTARGGTTGIDWREFTQGQLKSWGVKYHTLYMGKPEGDIFIDDKGIHSNDFFKE